MQMIQSTNKPGPGENDPTDMQGQLQAIKNNLTEQQLKGYKDAFSIFDKDGSGTITISELGAVLENLGQKLSPEELQEIIDEVDIDRNGEIDFDEFIFLMAKRQKATEQEETLSDAFKIFDQTGQGESITPEDIYGVLSKLGENVTIEEIREMFLEVDFQNAGKINYAQFVELMTSATPEKKGK